MVLESRVTEVFAQIDADQLPLSVSSKAVVAEFIGTQMCRGMQYRDLHRWLYDQRESALRARVRELYQEHAPDRMAEAETYDLTRLRRQNEVVRALVGTSQLLSNVIVNMRWQIIRWAKPILLSSDQPAICWMRPHDSSPWGASNAVEIRMPLSPTEALVASWHDDPDLAEIITGDKVAAMSMNHHTRRHAMDWLYWNPGSKPAQGHPLHDRVLSGQPPRRSRRLQLVNQLAQDLIEDKEQKITVFTPT